MKSTRILVAMAAIMLVGCGAAVPPKELVDARTAFQRAQKSKAAELTPVPLHEAKLALDAAEAAFQEDEESPQTRDLSYVAQRKAEYAETQGSTSAANNQKAAGEKEIVALQANMSAADLAAAKKILAQTQAGLQQAQQQAQQTQGELEKTKSQLNMTAEQLAAEKKAREAAEKRYRDAMDKLAVAAALAVKEEPRGTVITIPGAVLFPTNKYEVLPGAKQKLDAVADALKNQEDHKMVVEGHTDSQGSVTSNLELSQNRAQSVRDYLVQRGVKAENISATGVGQSRPVGDNATADGRAQNRRVEIIVKPIEKR